MPFKSLACVFESFFGWIDGFIIRYYCKTVTFSLRGGKTADYMKPHETGWRWNCFMSDFRHQPVLKAGSTTHCPKTTSAGHKPPKFNSLPVKNGGWKAILSYWGAEGNVFRGELAVKLRGGGVWEKKPVGHFDGKTYMTLENHHFF